MLFDFISISVIYIMKKEIYYSIYRLIIIYSNLFIIMLDKTDDNVEFQSICKLNVFLMHQLVISLLMSI